MIIVKYLAKYSLRVTLLPTAFAFQNIDKICNYLFDFFCVQRWIDRNGTSGFPDLIGNRITIHFQMAMNRQIYRTGAPNPLPAKFLNQDITIGF